MRQIFDRTRDQFSSQLKRSDRPFALDVLLPAIVATVLTAVMFIRVEKHEVNEAAYTNPDMRAYWELAQDPLAAGYSAFTSRILVPAIVHVMPFDLRTDYMIITFIGLTLTGIVVYHIARAFEFERLTSLLAITMFYSLSWASEYNVYDFWRPEPLAFFFFSLAFFAIVCKKDWLFVGALSMGVAAKTSVALVGPFYYGWNAEKLVDWSAIKRTVTVGMLPFAVLVGVRQIHPGSHGSAYPMEWAISLIPSRIALYAETFSVTRLHEWFIQPHGFLLVLGLIGAWYNRRLVVRFVPFGLCIYVQMLIAESSMRHLVMLFPALIVLALLGLRRLLTYSNKRLGTMIRPVYYAPFFVSLILFETRPRTFYPVRFYVQVLLFVGFSLLLFLIATSYVTFTGLEPGDDT
jgi:hypothetical protein